MNQTTPRRKARAIAISASVEAQRRLAPLKTLAATALGLGVLDALWTVHTLLAR